MDILQNGLYCQIDILQNGLYYQLDYTAILLIGLNCKMGYTANG